MIAKINPTCFTSNQARKNFIEFKEVFSWENSLEEQFIQPVANAIHSTNADLVFDKMKDILVLVEQYHQNTGEWICFL